MKTLKDTTTSQKPAGNIQLARLRVAKAESQLKSAKEQARLAKRRRKEARQNARHAKKQAKLAKQELAEAKLALAEAEAKLASFLNRPLPGPGRDHVRAGAAVASRRKTARPVRSHSPKSVKPARPTPRATKSRLSAGPKVEGQMHGVAASRAAQAPTVTASTPGSEDPRVGETEIESTVETIPPQDQTN